MIVSYKKVFEGLQTAHEQKLNKQLKKRRLSNIANVLQDQKNKSHTTDKDEILNFFNTYGIN